MSVKRPIVCFPPRRNSRKPFASCFPLAVHAAIGVWNLILGMAAGSAWFLATAVYYLLLCASRRQVFRMLRDAQKMKNPRRRGAFQMRGCRQTGVWIALIGISYFGVCLCMYVYHKTVTYPFYLLYGVAAAAFFKIGMAVYGIRTAGKQNQPLLSALKWIGFVDACVSIVAVQCALLTWKGEGRAASDSSALLGMGCSVIFLGIGAAMFFRRGARGAAGSEKKE